VSKGQQGEFYYVANGGACSIPYPNGPVLKQAVWLPSPRLAQGSKLGVT
jgi:hypothetical protein